MNRQDVAALIARHEGKHYRAYRDSVRNDEHPEGILTIGVGMNLEQQSARARIGALGIDYDQLCAGNCELTEAHVEGLFALDLADAVVDANALVRNFSSHPDDVQHVIVDMLFNLGGPRFAKFRKMIAALEAKDYRAAAAEMRDSLWAKQVPNRAAENIELVLRHAV